MPANPAVKEKAQITTAAKEAIRPAGALDNPEVSVGLLNLPVDTFAFNQVDMTNAPQLAVRQKIPFPGKRRLRSEVAAEQFHAKEYSYQDKVNEIRAKGLGLLDPVPDLARIRHTQRNKQFWDQVVRWRRPATAWARACRPMSSRPRWNWGITSTASCNGSQRQESVLADLNALRSKPPQTPLPVPNP